VLPLSSLTLVEISFFPPKILPPSHVLLPSAPSPFLFRDPRTLSRLRPVARSIGPPLPRRLSPFFKSPAKIPPSPQVTNRNFFFFGGLQDMRFASFSRCLRVEFSSSSFRCGSLPPSPGQQRRFLHDELFFPLHQRWKSFISDVGNAELSFSFPFDNFSMEKNGDSLSSPNRQWCLALCRAASFFWTLLSLFQGQLHFSFPPPRQSPFLSYPLEIIGSWYTVEAGVLALF